MSRHEDAKTRRREETPRILPSSRLRVPIHFTRFGTFYILFSLAVGGAAINTGNNLLYLMLGLLLGFIIISGILSDSCLWGLQTRFEPAGDFYAGQRAEWDLVASKTWFPGITAHVEAFWHSPHLRSEASGTGETTRGLFFWIPRYGSTSQRIGLTPSRRGLMQLESVRYATRFPFGLFEKSHRYERNESFIVFPRVKSLSSSQLQAGGLSFSDRPAQRKGAGAIPFDLREYKRGDSSKRIHWKSTARRGELMVTEMEEESAVSREVRVSAWPGEPEPFIDFLASLIYTLHRQGLPVGLCTPGVRFAVEASRSHLKKILTYLALVDTRQESAGALTRREAPSRALDALALWDQLKPMRPGA